MSATRIDVARGEDLAVLLRSAAGPVVTAVVAAPGAAPELSLIRAQVEVVALERAPGMRVNAVVAGPGGTPGAVAATVAYLETAAATTGQVIAVD